VHAGRSGRELSASVPGVLICARRFAALLTNQDCCPCAEIEVTRNKDCDDEGGYSDCISGGETSTRPTSNLRPPHPNDDDGGIS